MAQEKNLTTKEAAAILRIHPTNMAAMADNKEIDAFKVGRRWRFTPQAIDAYIQSNSNQQKQPT